ncbi:MAG: HAMP domain-containing histidine kinase [Clostridia bacterium]|nr:HAMP domain-containing histidine kinase [Clostridia bacterium]
MKRLRFFEKTYLITLLLFLLLLNACVFWLAYDSQKKQCTAAEQVCHAELLCIAEAFEKDYAVSDEDGDALLMLSYTSFYTEDGILLCFARDGAVLQSSIPDHFPMPEVGQYIHNRIDGVRQMIICTSVCDGAYTLTYAKDMSDLDEQAKRLAFSFIPISLFASLVLAICLFFVQRKLFAPLGKLSSTTKAIANGDLHARADETGHDEFAQLAKDFNVMSDRLVTQMQETQALAEQRQQMLDNLGHEMRTPLTSIYASAEHAFRNELDEETRLQLMLDIMSESERLRRISRILMDDAYIRENGIGREYISSSELLLHIHDIFVLRAAEKHIELNIVGDDLAIYGDKTLLEILLSNLTENAIRACRRNGAITLGAVMENGNNILFVRDNGIGMTEEQVQHITEPFYRTDKARSRKEGGTGLGLALCKRIADAHGASLVFSSAPDQGTTASLILKGDEA